MRYYFFMSIFCKRSQFGSRYKNGQFMHQRSYLKTYPLILIVCALPRWERTSELGKKKLFHRTEQFDYRRNRIRPLIDREYRAVSCVGRTRAFAIIKTVTRARVYVRGGGGDCSVSENVIARFYIA